MLFFIVVDLYWFQKGNNFWFEYKISEGIFWYVVDLVVWIKKFLFDRDELVFQFIEIVKDFFEVCYLLIINLKVEEDGCIFIFEVKLIKDVILKKDGKDKKDKKNEKEIFYFFYDYFICKLIYLKDKEDDLKKIYWGLVFFDGKMVIYVKDLNLYCMSCEDYEKVKKNEKDSMIVEIQFIIDGMKDFGYGIFYSMLNIDILCNGKCCCVGGVWFLDLCYFVMIVFDDCVVKELWVINLMVCLCFILEIYKYQMLGEKEVFIEYLYLFDLVDNKCKEIKVVVYKD